MLYDPFHIPMTCMQLADHYAPRERIEQRHHAAWRYLFWAHDGVAGTRSAARFSYRAEPGRIQQHGGTRRIHPAPV